MSVEANEDDKNSLCERAYLRVSDYIKNGGWTELSIGVLGAWLMPHLLPLHVPHLSEPLWGLACYATTLFVRKTLSLPTELASHVTRLEGVVGRAFYTGFYTLSAGDPLRDKFRKLDESLADPKISGDIRNIVFGFLAQSVAHVGESGLAMVDVEVSEYVQFLERLLIIPNQVVRATCVVRPYWFVTPFVDKVSLAPAEKADHLISFRDYQSTPTLPMRLAVYDERAIVDILLTGFIDREVCHKEESNCPSCNAIKHSGGKCPLHDARVPFRSEQIPEIRWFEEDVNKVSEKHVNLKYTRVRHEGRNVLSALEDRVFMQPNSNSVRIDLRFAFTNLSRGILWLRWGDKAQNFEDFKSTREGMLSLVCARNENHVPEQTHTIYEKFWMRDPNKNCLLGAKGFTSDASRTVMRDYLRAVLKIHVESKFEDGRDKINDSFQANMLSDGMRAIVIAAIDKLENEIKEKSLRQIYGELVDHYKEYNEPSAAYVVSYDTSHPDVPIVVAKWKENWEIVCKKG